MEKSGNPRQGVEKVAVRSKDCYSRFALRMLLFSALAFIPSQAFSQGFGNLGSKLAIKKPKETTLKRLLPASVNLNQKRIRVDAANASNARRDPELITILKTKLTTTIQKDGRFLVDEKNPETLLKFTITNYYLENRQMAGTKNGPPCTVWTGRIEASYQALEVRTAVPMDSENLKHIISSDPPKSSFLRPPWMKAGVCGTGGKATENEARDELIDAIVAQMAQRAGPTEQRITVPLPGGKLEPLSALALSQRWGTLLEQAEKMEKLPKPEDDAYRIYLIALANEALGYQEAHESVDREKSRMSDVTSDQARASMNEEEASFTRAQNYLDKATKLYKDAIGMKTAEKEFREPDARMEEAVTLYATIARHKQEYQQALLKRGGGKQASPGAATANNAPRSASGAPASPTQRVLELCKSKMADIPSIIKDHRDEFAFQKNPTLDEDLAIRNQCADGPAIIKLIRDSVAARAGSGKKK
jgi:hypothetical protein